MRNLTIKLVIFDFDGTLAYTMPFFYSCLKTSLREFGYRVSAKEIEYHSIKFFSNHISFKIKNIKNLLILMPFKISYTVTNSLFLTPFIGIKSLIRIKRYQRHNVNILPNKGSKKLLEYLKQKKYKIVLISMSGENVITTFLRKNDFYSYFDLIITKKNIKHSKKASFMSVLQKYNILPQEAVIVGDLPGDVLAGKALGLKTVALKTKIVPLNVIRQVQPNLIVSSLDQLIDFLEWSEHK